MVVLVYTKEIISTLNHPVAFAENHLRTGVKIAHVLCKIRQAIFHAIYLSQFCCNTSYWKRCLLQHALQ